MSTFTASGDLSLLFKVTWRIYLWLRPHYPYLHLLFDLLSCVQAADNSVYPTQKCDLTGVISTAAKLWLTLFLLFVQIYFTGQCLQRLSIIQSLEYVLNGIKDF